MDPSKLGFCFDNIAVFLITTVRLLFRLKNKFLCNSVSPVTSHLKSFCKYPAGYSAVCSGMHLYSR